MLQCCFAFTGAAASWYCSNEAPRGMPMYNMNPSRSVSITITKDSQAKPSVYFWVVPWPATLACYTSTLCMVQTSGSEVRLSAELVLSVLIASMPSACATRVIKKYRGVDRLLSTCRLQFVILVPCQWHLIGEKYCLMYRASVLFVSSLTHRSLGDAIVISNQYFSNAYQW